MNPQSATPPSIIDHSEGVNPNSLPSLITYVIIAWYLVLTRRTLAIAGGKGCSAQVTDQFNLSLVLTPPVFRSWPHNRSKFALVKTAISRRFSAISRKRAGSAQPT
jgi:hypothetical protein